MEWILHPLYPNDKGMLKKIFLLVIFFKSAFIISQPAIWHWAKEANSPGQEMGRDVTSELASGDLYVGGYFDNNLSSKYGSAFSSTYGQKDGFIAKYSSAGNVIWAIKIGGTDNDEVKALATDPYGNVYVVGNFKNIIDLDPSAASYTLSSTGGPAQADGFLAKYSSGGTLIWAIKFGGTQNDDVWKIFADSTHVYIAGQYMGAATFNSTNAVTKTTASTSAQIEFFGAKYDQAGIAQWVISGGSVKDDVALDVKADNSGVYFCGYYYHNMSLYNANATPAGPLAIVNPNKADAFLIKYSQSGTLIWATNAGSSDDDFGYGIAQDASSIYFTGSYRNNTINFPASSTVFTKTNQGGTDIFLTSVLKSTGVYQWASSQTGSGGGDEEAYELELDNAGNIVMAGYFKSNLNYSSFGGPNHSTSGNEDLFVTKFSSGGSFQSSLKAGANGADIIYGLTTHTTGAIYITGEHAGATTFGSTNLTPGAGKNIFVAKTGCEIITNNLITANQSICEGNTPSGLIGTLPAGSAGTYSYAWQQSTNASTWVAAGGINLSQNYSPSSLTVTTYYRRLVNTTGACLASESNTIQITIDQVPSVSNAGASQTVCSTSFNLNGNSPTVGSGVWQVVSGNASVASPALATSIANNLSVGQNIFKWTISNGACPSSSSSVIIIRDDFPTNASAGSDQTICNAVVTLNANTPFVGVGLWTILNGSSLLINELNPQSPVTGLSAGQNKFVWNISNGICPVSSDTVSIFRDLEPTPAMAGIDQHICGENVTLNANTPLTGNGNWNFISGSGTVSNSSDPFANISNLSAGTNIITWAVNNGVCLASVDTVIVTADAFPTLANAGNDVSVCSDNLILTANAPAIGTGVWTIISGTVNVLSVNQNNSAINTIGVGTNSLRWTITNGICPASIDDIIITRDLPPSVAIACSDLEVENPVADITAATPSVGLGYWSVVSGDAEITDTQKANTTVKNLSIGDNIIRWTTMNGVCPESSDDVLIYVKPLRIPNGFSPNEDGFNDAYVIPTMEFYNDVKFSVFNRWGGLVYENDNYKNEWKGTNLSGEKLSDDTYYYVLEVNKKLNFTGFIVLKQNK